MKHIGSLPPKLLHFTAFLCIQTFLVEKGKGWSYKSQSKYNEFGTSYILIHAKLLQNYLSTKEMSKQHLQINISFAAEHNFQGCFPKAVS